MTIEHKNITDPNIHEPKGIAAAEAGDIYVGDGASSGAMESCPARTYGGIYSDSSAIAISSIGTTAQKLAAFDTNMPSNGTTPDHTNDQITLSRAGTYLINFQCSFETTAAGDAGEYQYHIRVNAVESGFGAHRDMTGSSDIGSVSLVAIVTVSANDIVTVYVESDDGGGTDDIIIRSAQLTAILLKE